MDRWEILILIAGIVAAVIFTLGFISLNKQGITCLESPVKYYEHIKNSSCACFP